MSVTTDTLKVEFYVDDKGTTQLRNIAGETERVGRSVETTQRKTDSFTKTLRQNKELLMFWAASLFMLARGWQAVADASRKLDPASQAVKDYNAAIAQFSASSQSFKANVGQGLLPVLGGIIKHTGDLIGAINDFGVALGTGAGSLWLRIMGFDKKVVAEAGASNYVEQFLRNQRALTAATAEVGKTTKTGLANLYGEPVVLPDVKMPAMPGEAGKGGKGEKDKLYYTGPSFSVFDFDAYVAAREAAAQAIMAADAAELKSAQDLAQAKIALMYEEMTARADLFSTASGLVAEFGGKSTAAFLVSKGLALASTWVAGQQAEMMALATPPGPPATFPLAAMVRAKTMMNLAAIAATTLMSLGRGGGGGGGGAGGGSQAPVMGAERTPQTTIVIKGKGLENLIDEINQLTEDGGVRLVATDAFNAQFASYLR
jgi:hypothetical protein